MITRSLYFLMLLLVSTLLGACTQPETEPQIVDYSNPRIEIVARGLFGPIGMAEMNDGSILIAEEGSGNRDDSAGISLLRPDGSLGRLISGLPSTRDAGDLAGVPLVALSEDGRTLYLGNFGAGHLWTLALSEEALREGLEIPQTPLSPSDLGQAMEPLNNVFLVNPFDLTFSNDGRPVVSDASANGLAIETEDGRTRFFHRFEPLPVPLQEGATIEAVPTGIERGKDGEFLVTLTGGCPYPDGGGALVAVDLERNQRTILSGLTMPIDVTRGRDGSLWVLEFARFTSGADCFSGTGYQAESGRLSRLTADGTFEPILTELDFPGALLAASDGSLYISEVLRGQILRVRFDSESQAERVDSLALAPWPAVTPLSAPVDIDARLAQLIDELDLVADPGSQLPEGDGEMAELGRLLFFDPILSGDRNISCATCHHPRFAMADGRVLPIGTGGVGLGPERTFLERIELGPEASNPRRSVHEGNGERVDEIANPFAGQFVPRNSPTILNSALFPIQFWDGRVENYAGGIRTLEAEVNQMGLTDALAAQALFPVASLHEMAGATWGGLAPGTIRRRIVDRLNAVPEYRARFSTVFGGSEEEPVSMGRLATALAAFERELIYTASPWDDYIMGELNALDSEAKRGALLFLGGARADVSCVTCHSGDLLSDFEYHNLMVPELGPGKGNGRGGRDDWGRANVTFQAGDRYKFRTPSLRNVALTAPYFHNGAYRTLEDVVRHHAHIWNQGFSYDPVTADIPPAHYSSVQPFDPDDRWPTSAPELQSGMPLTDGDIDNLVAFLESLTDPTALDLDFLVPDGVPSGLPLDR